MRPRPTSISRRTTLHPPRSISCARRLGPNKRPAFFVYGLSKEAYLKATGAGLGIRLDSFAFTLAPVRISFLTDLGDLPQRWHFATLPTTGRHVLSVAIASQGDRPVRVMPRAVEARDL